MTTLDPIRNSPCSCGWPSSSEGGSCYDAPRAAPEAQKPIPPVDDCPSGTAGLDTTAGLLGHRRAAGPVPTGFGSDGHDRFGHSCLLEPIFTPGNHFSQLL